MKFIKLLENKTLCKCKQVLRGGLFMDITYYSSNVTKVFVAQLIRDQNVLKTLSMTTVTA